MEKLKKKIKDLIGNGKSDDALESLLLDIRDDREIHKKIILLKARYKKNEEAKDLGTKNDSEYTSEITKINIAIINLLSGIKEEDLKHQPHDKKTHGNKNCYKLPDIYIDPNFQVFVKNLKSPPSVIEKKYSNIFPETTLSSFLKDLFTKKLEPYKTKLFNPDSHLIILEGFPGQGKTLFCCHLYNDLDNNVDKKPIFESLHQISDLEEFAKEPFKIIKKTKEIQNDINSTVIILDGLNEIKEASKKLINKLIQNLLNGIKNNYPDTYVLITSRQSFIDSDDLEEDKILLLKLSPFNEEQQKNLIEKINKSVSNSQLNEQNLLSLKEKFGLLNDLIGIPAILYFLSTNNINIHSQLFDALFKYIFSREWDEEKIKPIKHINVKHFTSFFQYFSQILHREGEIINREDEEVDYSISMEKLASQQVLNDQFEECFGKNYEKEIAINYFLSAFFIEEKPGRMKIPGNTHYGYSGKFLHYYFLSKFIFETELKQTFPEVGQGNQIDPKKLSEALMIIWRCFVHPPLSSEIIDILCAHIEENEPDSENIGLIEKIENALPFIIENQLLYKYEVPGYSAPPIDKCLDGFFKFWQVLKSLDSEKSWIKASFLNKFVNLIRLEKNRIPPRNRPLNFSHQDLTGANFNNISFEGEIFDQAILNNAKFKNARFDSPSSFIESAKINNTKASNSEFNGAILRGIEMKDSDFSSSFFEEADLSGSIGLGAIFKGAKMDRINMSAGDFLGADFSGASMQEANLSSATILIGANLTDTDLTKADLNGADLSGAILDNAVLRETNLIGIIIDENTSFKAADLRGASISPIKSVAFETLAKKLMEAYSLYCCKDSLPQGVVEIIEKSRPDLFVNPDNPDI